MKRYLLGIAAGTILFASCKEIGPIIQFTNTKAADTTYVTATLPPAQRHNVLMEEFSGQACPNCPAGEDVLLSLSGSNAGRINIITSYIYGSPQTVPPSGATVDLRDSIGNNVVSAFYGSVTALPEAGIDRLGSPTANIYYSNDWPAVAAQQLAVTDSINLDVTTTYNDSGSAVIQATITYLYPTTASQKLTLAIVEDSIINYQEKEDLVLTDYVFSNVLRDFVTYSSGETLLPAMSQKEAGRVDIRRYNYNIHQFNIRHAVNDALVPQHCKVIAFISNAANNQVLQSAQTPLKGL